MLLVPRASNSPLTDLVDPTNTGPGTVVLYLDAQPERIGGDLAFHIPAWPARSSDADIRRLAEALRNFRKPAQDAQEASTRRTIDPNNLIALGFLALTGLGLFVLTQTSDSEEDKSNHEIADSRLLIPQDAPENAGAAATLEPEPESESESESELRVEPEAEPELDPMPLPQNPPTTAFVEPAAQSIAIESFQVTRQAQPQAPLWPTLPTFICPERLAYTPGQPAPNMECAELFNEGEHRFR